MHRLKYGIALMFALFLIFGFSLAALADNPHFISEGTDSINSSGALVATGFKEAGLGSTTTTEKITLSADATATYACINGGGKHPSATNKRQYQGQSVRAVISRCATDRPPGGASRPARQAQGLSLALLGKRWCSHLSATQTSCLQDWRATRRAFPTSRRVYSLE